MVYLKVFACLSCIVGLLQIASGAIVGAAPSLSREVTKLFSLYGIFGAFGELELVWMGLSIIAAIYCLKHGVSPIPPLCFVVFCLIHPLVGILIPAAAFNIDENSVNRFTPAVIEMFFGFLYVMLNIFFYKKLFFIPQLFEKTD